jgi:hypothetical protein
MTAYLSLANPPAQNLKLYVTQGIDTSAPFILYEAKTFASDRKISSLCLLLLGIVAGTQWAARLGAAVSACALIPELYVIRLERQHSESIRIIEETRAIFRQMTSYLENQYPNRLSKEFEAVRDHARTVSNSRLPQHSSQITREVLRPFINACILFGHGRENVQLSEINGFHSPN